MLAADLEPSAIQARLRTKWLGHALECFHEVDSTNTQVAMRGRTGAAAGLVIVADRQTAGRGRLQRAWHSPERVNLYFSILLRPPWPPHQPPPVSLAVGVALAETMERRIGYAPALKWPNDLLVHNRKLAGVLVEVAATRQHLEQVILGIGLNVNQETFPPPLDETAISLRQVISEQTDRGELLADLLNTLEPHLEQLDHSNHHMMIESWNSYFSWRGQKIRIQTAQGEFRGIALGASSHGALRIREESGQEREILSGDTFRIDDSSPQGSSPPDDDKRIQR
jgi:BirA family biotin operon repressor/biotin-[acetyl-CoA-carboxylase] ligase